MSAVTAAVRTYRTKNVEDKGYIKAFELRAHVIKAIGKEFLEGFEQWAFKSDNGMIYDQRVVFLWNCAHSSCQKEGHPINVIDEIIAIWKKRHEVDEAEWPAIIFDD